MIKKFPIRRPSASPLGLKKNNSSMKNFTSSSRRSADPLFITGGVTIIVSTHITFRNTIFLTAILGFLVLNLIPDMITLGGSEDTIHELLRKVRDLATLTDHLLNIISSQDVTAVRGEITVHLQQLLELQYTVFPNLQSQINDALSDTNLLDNFHQDLEEASNILEDVREQVRAVIEDLSIENMDLSN